MRQGAVPASSHRATRAVVDLDAIAGNVHAVMHRLSPRTRLMAVVKANAYGHGAVMVSRAALAAGATSLGVATVDEGMELRRAGIESPILVMGPSSQRELGAAVDNNLEITVGDRSAMSGLENLNLAHAQSILVQLKVDTGMHRFGIERGSLLRTMNDLRAMSHVRVTGLFTHFADADSVAHDFTDYQLRVFQSELDTLQADGKMRLPTLHAANSAAILRRRDTDFDVVRLGISLYGTQPSSTVDLFPGMKPALRLETHIMRVHNLTTGDTVSYGRRARGLACDRVALVPIGYADGYRRGLSNRAWMSHSGRVLPVLGRVCMDQSHVRLSPDVPARVGDRVDVFGDGSRGEPTVEHLAGILETIPYEVFTGITRRVPRIYIRDGEAIATEGLEGLITSGHS